MRLQGVATAASIALIITQACAWQVLGGTTSRELLEDTDATTITCKNVSQLMEGVTPVRTIQKPRLLAAKFPGSVDRRKDNYYWLRDRSDPAVIAHLKAENNATAAAMASTELLQTVLFEEIRDRYMPTDTYPPVRREDGYWYYEYRKNNSEYDIFARRSVPDDMTPPSIHDEMDESQPEQVLLDPNRMAKVANSSYFDIGTTSVSPDGQWLAYSVDMTGNEVYKLYVQKLAPPGTLPSKQLLGPIQNISGGSIVWAQDNSTLFCTSVETTSLRANVVWRYTATTAGGLSPGTLVYNETDPAFALDLSAARSREALFIFSASDASTHVLMLNASRPTDPWVPLGARTPGRRTIAAETRAGFLYTLEADSVHLNGQLLIAPLQHVNSSRVLLEHSVDVQLEAFTMSAGHLVLMAREKGSVSPLVYTLDASAEQGVGELGKPRRLEFPEETYTIVFQEQGPFNSAVSRMFYSGLKTLPSYLDFDLSTGQYAVKKQLELVGEYDEDRYRAERIWVTSTNNVKVPVDLLYRHDLLRKGSDGGNPALVEAYGAYGVSIDPSFDADRLSLLDRGFLYVLAHPRGGGELGEYWHRDGMLLKKRNTFDDVIAVIEHLIQEGYSSRGRVVLWGRSAGGLTAGAVLNMRPDLLQAVVLEVAFLDVLTTERDVTLPLTVGEWEEWGDPLHNKTYYDYIKSYSPLDNVIPQVYPHVLALAGMNDPRVSYWEPAKMIAKLRATATSHNLTLLQVQMDSGHFASTGRLDSMRQEAFKYAFIMTAVSACSLQSSSPSLVSGPLTVAAAVAVVVLLVAVLAALFGKVAWTKAKAAGGSRELRMRPLPQHAAFDEDNGYSPSHGSMGLLPIGHVDSAAAESAAEPRGQRTKLSSVTLDRLARKR